MKIRFEVDLINNPAIGAIALWQFSRAFFDANNGIPPDMRYCMLVLPFVFHLKTKAKISRMQFDSGLLKALHEAPEIIFGLQARLESQADRTFRALNLACSGGLLVKHSSESWPTFAPIPTSLPKSLESTNDDVRSILKTAKRLGIWFAGIDFISLCSRLNVRF